MSVVNSIGAGKDYTTLQNWENDIPATPLDHYIGEQYDTESGAGGRLTIDGHTTSSSATIKLTALGSANTSFRSNVNVQTNALKFNTANGVGITKTDSYDGCMGVGDDWVLLEGLQISSSHSTSLVLTVIAVSNVNVNYCIIQSAGQIPLLVTGASTNIIRNSLIVQLGSGLGIFAEAGAQIINCTVARPTDVSASSTGIASNSGTTSIKNTVVINFSADTSGTISATTCATDDTTPSTGFTGSLTPSNLFENVLNATQDWRAKTGGEILDTATTDSTNAPIDIAGTTRPQGAAYDIGCWEKVSAGAPTNTNMLPGMAF